MVSPIFSSSSTKSLLYSPKSPSVIASSLHNPSFGSIPLLGISHFSPWSGLKHLGISNSPPKAIKIVRKGRCKGKVVYASLFGVGAPEALVIGVVALLVFGPKGLAEVARNLGKTLRAFQPTIRELQDVSREFKSTLEREIGLDDIASPTQNTYRSEKTSSMSAPSSISSTEESLTSIDPNGAPSSNKAYTSEDYLKITEEQLKASAAQQPEQMPSPKESQIELQTPFQATVQEGTAAMPPPTKPEIET